MVLRSLWSGSISFGLVNIPVKMYSATRDRGIHFNQLHEKDHARIRYKKVCAAEEEEVSKDEIVRGYKIAPGKYVTITDEEIESAEPASARNIEIEDFVPLSEIDPAYFDRPYWLVPDKAAGKAYALLHETMTRSKKVAVARVVMRSKEHLVALRAVEDAVMMVTLRFGDEVVPAGVAMAEAESEVKSPSEKEMMMAEALVQSLSAEFDPDQYKDQYREAVLALVEKKLEGQEIEVAPTAERRAVPDDILAALELSVQRAREGLKTRSAGTNGSSDGKTKGATASSNGKGSKQTSGSDGKKTKSSKKKGKPKTASKSKAASQTADEEQEVSGAA